MIHANILKRLASNIAFASEFKAFTTTRGSRSFDYILMVHTIVRRKKASFQILGKKRH